MYSARTRRTCLTVVGLLLLGLGCWQGSALAGRSSSEKATAKNYVGKGDCGGENTAFPVAGTTTFKLKDGTLTVSFKETGLTPDTTYEADLWYNAAPGACSGYVDMGQLTTNKKGHGKAKFTIPVPEGYSYFFSGLFDAEGGPLSFNDSTTVYLP